MLLGLSQLWSLALFCVSLLHQASGDFSYVDVANQDNLQHGDVGCRSGCTYPECHCCTCLICTTLVYTCPVHTTDRLMSAALRFSPDCGSRKVLFTCRHGLSCA